MESNDNNLARIESSMFAIKRLVFRHDRLAGAGRHLLSPPLFILVAMLARHQEKDREPMTATELAAAMHVSLSMITQMINELEEKDIVRRTRSDDDRRVTYISLSRRGRGMLHRLQRHGRPFGVLNELLDYLGPRDSAELARLSERISQFLNEKCGRKNHNV